MSDTLLNTITELHRLNVLDHGITELLKDILVDVDSLNSQANLAGVRESDLSDLWCSLGDIDVLGDDTWVVTTKLESHALEGLGAGLHDLLASEGGAGEGDLVNLGRVSQVIRDKETGRRTSGWEVIHGPRLSSPERH